jgi:hypothetical protein
LKEENARKNFVFLVFQFSLDGSAVKRLFAVVVVVVTAAADAAVVVVAALKTKIVLFLLLKSI